MRCDKEEVAREESIHLDSESESTIDTPWSDGSTLHSIEEKVKEPYRSHLGFLLIC